jgi:hypothetical protein
MGSDFVNIPVVITASLRLAGRTIERGSVVKLDPASAAAVVAAGRGRLENPDDRAVIDDYWKRENDRVLAACGRVPRERMRSWS